MNRFAYLSVCWWLIVSTVVSPGMLPAQDVGSASLDTVSSDAVAGVVVYPKRTLASEQAELWPTEILSAAGKQYVGIDPMNIDWIVLSAELNERGQPLVILAAGLSQDFDLSQLTEEVRAEFAKFAEQTTLDSRPYWRAAQPMAPSIYMPDARTLLAGTEPAIQAFLGGKVNTTGGHVRDLLTRQEGLDGQAAATPKSRVSETRGAARGRSLRIRSKTDRCIGTLWSRF